MKKTLILVALAFATAGTAFAQTKMAPVSVPTSKVKIKKDQDKKPKQTPEQKADHRASKMAKELGLTADQESRVEKILLARQQEMQALKAKTGTDRKAAQPEMKALKERYNTQLKGVLTAEQYTKFDQLKDEHKGHGKGQGGHSDGKAKIKTKS